MSWRRLRRLVLRLSEWLSRQAEKYSVVLFIAAAVIILWSQLGSGTYLGPEMSTRYPTNYVLSVFISIMILFSGGFTLALVVAASARLHLWIKHRFEESVDSKEPRLFSQLFVSALLNIVVILILTGLVPASSLASVFHLETWADLFQQANLGAALTRVIFLFTLLSPGAVGPLILYWVRMYRRRGGNPCAGASSVAVLQFVCYAALGILLLWLTFPAQVAAALHVQASPQYFFLYFLDPVLPSTLLCIVAIRYLEEMVNHTKTQRQSVYCEES